MCQMIVEQHLLDPKVSFYCSTDRLWPNMLNGELEIGFSRVRIWLFSLAFLSIFKRWSLQCDRLSIKKTALIAWGIAHKYRPSAPQ